MAEIGWDIGSNLATLIDDTDNPADTDSRVARLGGEFALVISIVIRQVIHLTWSNLATLTDDRL